MVSKAVARVSGGTATRNLTLAGPLTDEMVAVSASILAGPLTDESVAVFASTAGTYIITQFPIPSDTICGAPGNCIDSRVLGTGSSLADRGSCRTGP